MKHNFTNTSIISTYALFFVLVLFSIKPANAQMVAPSAYIQGTSLEIGINGAGGFEGVDQSISPPPPGYHARTAFAPFGFIADPAINAWASYDGDFFTPGTPENGWGIEIGTTGGPSASNNYWNTVTFSGNQVEIPGAITSWTHTFNCYTADWQGNMTTGGTNLHVKINYFLQQSDVYYTTTVSITNNTSATIPDMYYYRNLDPDNDEEIGFDFSTTNTIVSEPSSGTCQLAHVSATSIVPGSQPQSYIGLAGVGPNFRVDYGGFSNRDGSDLWNGGSTGSGTFTQTVGSVDPTTDEGISLAYRIQNLAPGATETFKFVVILDDASAGNAVNNLLYLAYPGSASLPPAVCTPFVDTVRTCGAPVPVSIGGSVVNDFSWSWSPGTGLNVTDSANVIANPATTTSYTITGTPLSTCVAPVTLYVVVKVTPGGGNNPYITPVPNQCSGSAPFNLTVDSTGGVWSGTGITNDTLGTFDPGSVGPGTYMISYTTPGDCNTTDTVLINVIGASSATITQPPTICFGTPPITLSAATSGGTWTGTGVTSASAGTFDPNVSGPGSFVVTYTIPGLCISQDTVTVTVGAVTTPVTGFSYTSPVCVSSGATPTPAPVAGFTPGGTYSTTSGALTLNATTGVITGLSTTPPGTYVITYSVPSTVCGPAGTSSDTLVIDPVIMPVTNFSYITPICINTPNPAPDTVPGFTIGGAYSSTPGLNINPLTGTINLATTTPGTYTVTYTVTGNNALCLGSGTSTSTITINPLPTVTVSPDVTMFIGASTTLIASGGTGYIWTPPTGLSCVTCDTTVASPTETTIYCVKVTNLGCVDSTCRKVSIEIPCPGNRNLTVPNAFTPNGDGVNDELCLEGWNDCVEEFQIYIYDRWGEKVYESKNPSFCWDGIYKGKPLDPAVFVYFIKASYIKSGSTVSDPTNVIDITKKGNISLVR